MAVERRTPTEETSKTADVTPRDDRVNRGGGARHWARVAIEAGLQGRLPVLFVLVVLIAVFSLTGQGFFTSISFQNIVTSTSLFLLIGLGETFVMISGGIDISLPSNLAFSALTAGILMTRWYHGHGEGTGLVVLIALIVLVVGSLIGLLNGLIISFMNVSPLIVTLGTWGAFFGLAEWLSVTYPIVALPPASYVFGNDGPGVNYVVWTTIGCVLIFAFVLSRLRFGRYVLAIGANREAAVRAGIPVKRLTLEIYAIAGLMAGLAGFVSACHFQTASSETGSAYLLTAIAAVVIGGTPLTGGEGSIVGTVIGAFIISVLDNGFVIAGINTFLQLVAVGAATILAVFFTQYQGRLRLRAIAAHSEERAA
jgi:ribose transport system permease protein